MNNQAISTEKNRYKITKRVTWISLILNGLMTLAKIITGYVAYSEALIADGLHSLSDLVTDGFLLFAAAHSAQSPDREHPYGHGRIETAASVGLAILLILVGLGMAYHALLITVHNTHTLPEHPALWVALISIFINEWLFRYTLKAGKKIKSQLLISNAWHHRSDSLTSFIVLLTLLGALLGIKHLDAIGAVIIAGFIVKVGGQILWQSLKELIDTGVDDKDRLKITQVIKETPGVKSLHMLRTRTSGGQIFADVHIIVDDRISVSEGHYISDQVHEKLLQNIENMKDVTVHIDPEDDEIINSTGQRPDRQAIQQMADAAWQQCPHYDKKLAMNLHYIGGKIDIDLIFPADAINPKELIQMQKGYQTITDIAPYINSVTLYLRVTS